MNSKKVDEKHQRILRELLKKNDNKRCFDCPSKSPAYANLFNNTFVCVRCSGLLREFGHRVKSIGASSFTPAEVKALEEGGNIKAQKVWLATWSNDVYPEPSESDDNGVRVFMKAKYAKKKFYKEDAPATETSVSKSGSDETNQSVKSENNGKPSVTTPGPSLGSAPSTPVDFFGDFQQLPPGQASSPVQQSVAPPQVLNDVAFGLQPQPQMSQSVVRQPQQQAAVNPFAPVFNGTVTNAQINNPFLVSTSQSVQQSASNPFLQTVTQQTQLQQAVITTPNGFAGLNTMLPIQPSQTQPPQQGLTPSKSGSFNPPSTANSDDPYSAVKQFQTSSNPFGQMNNNMSIHSSSGAYGSQNQLSSLANPMFGPVMMNGSFNSQTQLSQSNISKSASNPFLAQSGGFQQSNPGFGGVTAPLTLDTAFGGMAVTPIQNQQQPIFAHTNGSNSMLNANPVMGGTIRSGFHVNNFGTASGNDFKTSASSMPSNDFIPRSSSSNLQPTPFSSGFNASNNYSGLAQGAQQQGNSIFQPQVQPQLANNPFVNPQPRNKADPFDSLLKF